MAEHTSLEDNTEIDLTIPLAEPDGLPKQEESRRLFLGKFSDFFGAFTILVVLWIDVNFVRSTNGLNHERYFRDSVILCFYHLVVMLWCCFVVKTLTSRQRPFEHDAFNFLLLFFEFVLIAMLIAMLLQQIFDEMVSLAIAER